MGLNIAEGFDKLYPTDYMKSLTLLQTCSISNESTPISTFETAVAMLNKGDSVESIHAKLATVKRFKDIIGEAPKQFFAPQSKASAPNQPLVEPILK
jgi:hypothetical protein